MRTRVIFLAVLAILWGERGFLWGQAPVVSHFETAKTISVQEKKYIFLYFQLQDCSLCRDFYKQIWQKEEFQKWAQEDLVLFSLDFSEVHPFSLGPEEQKQKEEGEKLRQLHKVEKFPTLILEDDEGKVFFRRSPPFSLGEVHQELIDVVQKKRLWDKIKKSLTSENKQFDILWNSCLGNYSLLQGQMAPHYFLFTSKIEKKLEAAYVAYRFSLPENQEQYLLFLKENIALDPDHFYEKIFCSTYQKKSFHLMQLLFRFRETKGSKKVLQETAHRLLIDLEKDNCSHFAVAGWHTYFLSRAICFYALEEDQKFQEAWQRLILIYPEWKQKERWQEFFEMD